MENKSLKATKPQHACCVLKPSDGKAYTINNNKIYIYTFFIYLINYLCRGVYPLFLLRFMLKAIQGVGFKTQQVAFSNKLEKTVFGGAK